MKAFTFQVSALNLSDASSEQAMKPSRNCGGMEISPSTCRSYTKVSLKRV